VEEGPADSTAPGTKHPMGVLLGKAGRAWYFAANQEREGQFAIPNCGEVPQLLERAYRDLKMPDGEVETLTYGIEGCFPNMPKEAIKLAMKDIAKQEQARGHEGVWVPHSQHGRSVPGKTPHAVIAVGHGSPGTSCWTSWSLQRITRMCECHVAPAGWSLPFESHDNCVCVCVY
jgi:hypothetical protein